MKNITSSLVKSLLLKRDRSSHKGDFGHVLILAGSKGMMGAGILAAHGALRSGAGLVTLGSPEKQLSLSRLRLRPEIMTAGFKEKDGSFSKEALKDILRFIKDRKVSAVAFGPGVGRDEGINSMVKVLLRLEIVLILDADALNTMSVNGKKLLKNAKADIVCTPHPGELSRLTGITVKDIQRKRIMSAEKFAANLNVVCVLKGSGTVVTDGSHTFVNTTGNPGMATGGSGDVLSGMIAALSSQVKERSVLNAAVCGVYLHGLAGDIAAKVKTQIGMVAGDISGSLPAAIKRTGIK